MHGSAQGPAVELMTVSSMGGGRSMPNWAGGTAEGTCESHSLGNRGSSGGGLWLAGGRFLTPQTGQNCFQRSPWFGTDEVLVRPLRVDREPQAGIYLNLM